MEEIVDEEIKIVLKINRFLKENELSELLDVEELDDSVQDLKNLQQDYEEVHVKLQRQFGDEYSQKYNKFDENALIMMNWLKVAKRQLRTLKSKSGERVLDELRVEEKFVSKRIGRELQNVLHDPSTLVEDLERHVNVAENLVIEYSKVFMKIEAQGTEFRQEFGTKYDDQCKMLDDFISSRRNAIHGGRMAQKMSEEKRLVDESAKRCEAEKEDKILSCQNMYGHMCDRFSNLELKLKVQICELSDLQVLEKKKEILHYDKDVNDILDKIFKLKELHPERYDETEGLNQIVTNRKNNLLENLNDLKGSIDREISERGISEEKVKNASVLGLELPKFGGYKSELDFYSFKTKFMKWIAPKIKHDLLAEHLKYKYLEGQALRTVREMDDIESIWTRLKECFGHVPTLLNKKLEEFEKGPPLVKIQKDDKIIDALLKIRNLMKELGTLARDHGIEQILYHPSNSAKLFNLLGKKRQIDITKALVDEDPSEEETWDHILKSLDKEIRIREKLLLLDASSGVRADKDKPKSDSGNSKAYTNSDNDDLKCHVCGKTNHIPKITNGGKTIINYHACDKFVEMTPKLRFENLKGKNLCLQCLSPGRKHKHQGRCFNLYACPHESHRTFKRGIHILVCDAHKTNPENLALLEQYKTKCIENGNYAEFSKNIGINFHVHDPQSYGVRNVAQGAKNDIKDVAVFLLQTISVGGVKIPLFYDNGCSDLCITKKTVDLLEKQGRAVNITKEARSLTGLGDLKTVATHGKYQITLPLYDGTNVDLSGACLDKITSCFPIFPLEKVAQDLEQDYARLGNDPTTLPRLPESVGGETAIMIGSQYMKYFPDQVHRLPNGLTLYKSQFLSDDGTRGLVNGPHKSFSELFSMRVHHVFFTEEAQEYLQDFRQDLHMGLRDMKASEVEFTGLYTDKNSLLEPEEGDDVDGSDDGTVHNTYKCDDIVTGNPDRSQIKCECEKNDCYLNKKPPKSLQIFEKIENAGTEVSYRCVKCRGCYDCKENAHIELTTIEQEIHQGLIDKSVTVNTEECYSEAYLPFLSDPTKRLADNYDIALRCYYSQTKKLSSKPDDRKALASSMDKLRSMGFVSKIDELSDEQKNMIESAEVKFYIPWLAAWNPNSVSTPCRPVFHASKKTKSGYSLNCLLPKGRNQLNKLVQIFISWLANVCAYCTDIQKMYNSIRLVERHWCYQLFLWDDELRANIIPIINVIKTLIYGVRTSGNQAERALRETTKIFAEEYPRQNEVIQKHTYVDDCASGETAFNEKGEICKEASYKKCRKVTDDLQIVLNKGNFKLKGVVFSGMEPPEHLCNEDKHVALLGAKWDPKLDLLSLNIGDGNFGKIKHGKKSDPSVLTRVDCASEVGKIFDINGRFAPLVTEFKLDLRELCFRKLDWTEPVPDELLLKWKNNFDRINKMREIKFQRCIIPEDAINLEMETIEVSDASSQMACSAIYVRLKRKNGLYSCQLVFARTKIVPRDMTLPRAELFAATLNATTAHIVRLSLQDHIESRLSLIDSQIALFWIANTQSELKQWARNRVIEITRLTDKNNWYYVDTKNNSADIATRRGAKITDISAESIWVTGHDWAKHGREKFPIKSVQELKMSKDEMTSFKQECLGTDLTDPEWVTKQLSENYYSSIGDRVLEKVGKRYQHSKYIVDPNKYRFKKVVRIVALVLQFLRNIKRKRGTEKPFVLVGYNLPALFGICNDRYLVTNGKNPRFKCKTGLIVEITEKSLLEALFYFFQKATDELKHFNRKNSYEKFSIEKNGILFYAGRILPSQEFDNKHNLQLSDACIDLTSSTFCVPIVDKFSPLAYALINEVHWHDPDARHLGNETVMRYLLKVAYVIEGAPLVELFRSNCPRCRFLLKRMIEVAMGPRKNENLTIAPPFYYSQVDLFGPFNTYSHSNKRASVKCWFVIFCCTVTGCIDLRVAEDYSTMSVVDAYIRMSCNVGYPRKLLPDAGSQLLKACGTMTLTFHDINHELSVYGCDFEPCPVNAHYMHGKVERKIRQVKETFTRNLNKERWSILRWETFGQQVANSVNNLPIAKGKKSRGLEQLDLITPNRLKMARNNNRSPVGTITLTEDVRKIMTQNNKVFEAWFKAWLTSCVPTLMHHPKWFKSDEDPRVGDIVLFLKSDKEFNKIYQFGIITDLKASRDGKIRQVEVQYQNYTEKVKRTTSRGTREIVVIHPFGELGLTRELNILAAGLE